MLYAYELIFFGLLSLQDYSFSLRLVEIRIPNYVIKGSSAQLECLYDLDGEALYSVKWYKDGNEFYRYVPRDMPPAQTFLLPGVSVDVHNSSDAVVTLREVTLQSAGRFRCEVSGEAPSFQTVTEHGDMIVVSLPDQGPPKISGGRPRYQIGDWVRINCTAGRSKPAVQLSWFINGEPADPHTLKKYDVIISGREGLETSVLGLQFRVEQHHFRNGDMKLKCVASLSTFYWRSNEESVEGDRPQKAPVLESRETVYASNSRADPVQGMSLRDSFLNKILSFFIQPNAASSNTDSMVLNKNSTNLQILIIALVTLAIIHARIEHIYLTGLSYKMTSISNGMNKIKNKNNTLTSSSSSASLSASHIRHCNRSIDMISFNQIKISQTNNEQNKNELECSRLQAVALNRHGLRHGKFLEQQQQSLYEISNGRGDYNKLMNHLNFNEEMSDRHHLDELSHLLALWLLQFPFLISSLTFNIQQQQQQQQLSSVSVAKKLTMNNSMHFFAIILTEFKQLATPKLL